MKFVPRFFGRMSLLGVGIACIAASCGRNDIQVYRVGKESVESQSQPASATAAMPLSSSEMGQAQPKLQWKLPAGWQEVAPGEMRVASFRVAGKDGKQADVSVVPLPGMAGGDFNNVNRWRSQVGLAAVTEEELPQLAQAVQIAGQPAQMYEQAGTNPGSGDSSRILAAISRRDGTAWFFKITGDSDLVAQQKQAFIEWLDSVKFSEGPTQAQLPPSHPPIGGAAMPAPMANGSAVSAGNNKPEWQVPSDWKEVSGGQFLVAKFILSGTGNAQAAVNVSMSAGDGGGPLANINRWRGQLGAAALSESDLPSQLQSLDLPGGKANIVSMAGTDGRTGQPARLVAAIVSQGNQTWFYKLMGNAEIVERQKDAFTKFVQTAKYPR